MKYKLGEKHPTENLYRVVALKDFGYVKAGDIGGWVKSGRNLSQDGDCWVRGNAWVYGNARVYGNAQVFSDAQVYGNAQVFSDAWVYGNAQVYGNTKVYGNAQVYGNAWVSGNAEVYDNAWVYGKESGPSKPEWMGLTDEDMAKIKSFIDRPEMILVVAFIEAKLKEKNT